VFSVGVLTSVTYLVTLVKKKAEYCFTFVSIVRDGMQTNLHQFSLSSRYAWLACQPGKQASLSCFLRPRLGSMGSLADARLASTPGCLAVASSSLAALLGMLALLFGSTSLAGNAPGLSGLPGWLAWMLGGRIGLASMSSWAGGKASLAIFCQARLACLAGRACLDARLPAFRFSAKPG